MQRVLGASVAVLMSSCAAVAQDTQFNRWNGPYIGLHVGPGWGDSDVTCTSGCLDQVGSTIDTDGPAIGGQIGWNWLASDQIVLGLEADASFADIDGDAFFGGKNASSDLEAFGTARARAGFLVTPSTMIYATGGLAWGDWSDNFVPLAVNNSWSDVYVGWTAGGGFETNVSENLSFKVEYLYMDFGDETNKWSDGGLSGKVNFDHQIHTVRMGVNYKLW